MPKIINLFKKHIFWLLIIILTIPTFARMLKPGIYSMQDFHYFRLVEYGKCFHDFVFPCRWASDAGLGYGEPLFNFYGQLPYLLGQVFRLVGFSNIDSLKLLFILSLLGSAVSMFLVSKRLWRNNFSALLSSLVYLYAPYRAVDVWVRGALPEALAFVLFPLIVYFVDLWFDKKEGKYLMATSILMSFLIITHNLSFIMFLFFLVPWFIYELVSRKEKIKLIRLFLLSFLFALALAAFYLLPVIFESQFINLMKATTKGYFDFRGHFLNFGQILYSRVWGYGGSVFGPEDGLNLSVGLVQWLLPVVVISLLIIQKKKVKLTRALTLMLIGWLMLFLTHNKSAFVWELITPMRYIQFPWRFLSLAIFSFSLCVGALDINRKLEFLVIILSSLVLFYLTSGYFKEDIWYLTNDVELTSGQKWVDQSRASIGDFWPKTAKSFPDEFANYQIDNAALIKKTSYSFKYRFVLDNAKEVSFPVVSFPGWKVWIDNTLVETGVKRGLGQITVIVPKGKSIVYLKFTNTPVRVIGNTISLLSCLCVTVYFYRRYRNA